MQWGDGAKKKSFSFEKDFLARNAYFDTGVCFETLDPSIVILLGFR